ncbi:MAG: GNAT family N-acetyltransferase [Methylococcaceae bacterium]|nr:GNAT family N-acetyltransferase [Methylococcaceae bacterium]
MNEPRTSGPDFDLPPEDRITGCSGTAQGDPPGESPPSIRIVPIAQSHIPGFHACLDTVAREQSYLAFTEAPPFEQTQAFVNQMVAIGAAQFVAVDGDTVVGWADVLPAWGQAVAHCGRLGMGVLPGYRGRGIGTRLVQACLDQAKTQGLSRIELEARADNTAALRLYEKFGFVREAVKPKAMKFEGRYYETVQMGLLLELDGA